jgi:predicted helicase
MVFSSLVVVEQFLRTWLAGVREVQVVVVCSAEEGEAAGTATGDSAPVVTQIRLVTDLVVRFRAQRAVPLVVLTSYQSAHKVNAALVEADDVLDLAVFDEAHFSRM